MPCLVILVPAWLAAASQQSVFRTASRSVFIWSPCNQATGLVTELPRKAFEVFDNGRPQEITLFESGTQPISIVVMLDTSDSMLGNLTLVRNAAVQMFMHLLPEDRVRVGTFGQRIQISGQFTSDAEALIRALWHDVPIGGPTRLSRSSDFFESRSRRSDRCETAVPSVWTAVNNLPKWDLLRPQEQVHRPQSMSGHRGSIREKPGDCARG